MPRSTSAASGQGPSSIGIPVATACCAAPFQVPGARLSGRLGGGRSSRRTGAATAADVDPLHQCAKPAGAGRDAAPGWRGCPLSPAAPPLPSASSRCGPPCCACCRGSEHLLPDGGYFLWLEFDPRLDSRALHAQALASGFSLAPGALFSSKGCTTTVCASTAPIPGASSWRRPSPGWPSSFTNSWTQLPPKTKRPHDGACSLRNYLIETGLSGHGL